jgi:hypothetical protein
MRRKDHQTFRKGNGLSPPTHILEDSEEKLRRPSGNAIVCSDTRHALGLIVVHPDIATSTEETVSMTLKGATR